MDGGEPVRALARARSQSEEVVELPMDQTLVDTNMRISARREALRPRAKLHYLAMWSDWWLRSAEGSIAGFAGTDGGGGVFGGDGDGEDDSDVHDSSSDYSELSVDGGSDDTDATRGERASTSSSSGSSGDDEIQGDGDADGDASCAAQSVRL